MSMAKLPMKQRLPMVKENANLCGRKIMTGRHTKNANKKNSMESTKANTNPCKEAFARREATRQKARTRHDINGVEKDQA